MIGLKLTLTERAVLPGQRHMTQEEEKLDGTDYIWKLGFALRFPLEKDEVSVRRMIGLKEDNIYIDGKKGCDVATG